MRRKLTAFALMMVMIIGALPNATYALSAGMIDQFEGTSINYDEADGTATLISPNVIVNTSGTYMSYEVNNATEFESLALEQGSDSTPETGDGVVSVVGDYIYLGDGTTADIIGSIDLTDDGQNGNKLGINFSKALVNSIFTEGFEGGDLPGWEIIQGSYAEEMMVYGTRSQGRELYVQLNGDGSTTMTLDGTDGYTYTTSSTYDTSIKSAWGYESVIRPVSVDGDGNYTSSLSTTVTLDSSNGGMGGVALKLWSDGSVYSNNNVERDLTTTMDHQAYGSEFGPIVISDPFTAEAGDSISIDWKAVRLQDDYEVYGFVVNTSTDEHTLVFYSRGMSQDWTTSVGTIPEDGEYQFKFVNGTYDQTGGYAVGSSMWIDNIRVFGSVDNPADVLQQIGRLVTYSSTDKDPDATRTITMSLDGSDEVTYTADMTVAITNRFNHPSTLTTDVQDPTFYNLVKNNATVYGNTAIDTIESAQTVASLTLTVDGILDGSDEMLRLDGSDVILVDGTSGTTSVNGFNYTVSVAADVATVIIEGTGIGTYLWEETVDTLSYYNGKALPTVGVRTVTLTELKDNGGTANSGQDTTALNEASDIAISLYEVGDFDLTSNTVSTANFTWSQVTGATSIVVLQSINGGTWTTANTSTAIDPTDTSTTVTNLYTNRDYHFRLQVSGGLNAGLSNIETLTIDGTAPEVLSMVRYAGGAETVTSDSAIMLVTFDEPVEDVTTDDFGLNVTDTLSASVSEIIQVTPTTYKVVLGDFSGVGSMRLKLLSGTDISDALGNTGVSSYVAEEKFNVPDIAYPPVISTPIMTDDYINAQEVAAVTIEGTSEALATVHYVITDHQGNEITGDVTADSAGNWSVTEDVTSLLDGPLTIQASITDLGGSDSQPVTATVVKDTLAPQISGVVDGETYATNKVITFNEGVGTLDGDIISSGTAVNDNGTYTIRVEDNAGNDATVNFTIYNKQWIQYLAFAQGDSENNVTQNLDYYTEDNLGNSIEWKVIGATTNSPTQEVVIDTTTDAAIYITTSSAVTITVDPSDYITTGAALSVLNGDGNSAEGANITLPELEDVLISLEATTEFMGEKTVKAFTLVLKAMLSDSSAVAYSKAHVGVLYQGDDTAAKVTNDVILVSKGSYDTTITWTSDKPTYVTGSGAVTRPAIGEKAVTVTLTATISKNDVIEEKVFTLIIKPEVGNVIRKDVDDEVDEGELDEVIETGEPDIYVILDGEVTTDTAVKLKLTKEQVTKVVEQKKRLKVKTDTVTFDVPLNEDALNLLSDSTTNTHLELVIEKLDTDSDYAYLKEELSGDSSLAIYNRHVYDFSIKAIEEDEDGEIINESTLENYHVDDEIELTIVVGTDALDNEVMLAFYYNPESEHWEFVQSNEDRDNGSVIITTNHLSIYSIMYVEDGTALQFLLDTVLNNTDPNPTLTEIRNIIESEAVGLDVEDYNKLTEAKKDKLASTILQARPVEGYTVESFLKTFNFYVDRYLNGTSGSSNSNDETVVDEIVDDASIFFEDIEGHWAESYINALAQLGIVEGDGTNYGPNLGITRAEIAALVVRIGEFELTEEDDAFDDVDVTDWYAAYIATARLNNLVKGVSDTEYEPERIVTRQELVTILMRLYSELYPEAVLSQDENKFIDDAKIYAYAKESVYDAKELGIVEGDNAFNFNPIDTATRAEAAAMIYRFLDKAGKLQ